MEKRRTILHCDCNNFFASCECLDHPEWKTVPMAVAGDPERRAGIVVAKNELAKRAGVKTTDTIWQAREKCPGILFVPPRHHLYSQISKSINRIYREYTDYVEPASIDESFLDLSDCLGYYGMSGREFADMLRARVRTEIGVTISVGVSFNKTFAKMGSDYKKPDATTVITEETFRALLWPLPASDMLFVGKSAAVRLERAGIQTIGDLANAPAERLRELLGKGGLHLRDVCNGLDASPVRLYGDRPESKSISRGTTFSHDLTDEAEVLRGVLSLSDAVAAQLRREHLKGSSVQVFLKSPQLKTISRQATLRYATNAHREIESCAMELIRANWKIGPGAPIRAITVGVTRLAPAEEVAEQISLFDLCEPGEHSLERRERQEKLESAIDQIRQKHGRSAILRGYSVRDGKK